MIFNMPLKKGERGTFSLYRNNLYPYCTKKETASLHPKARGFRHPQWGH
jgi:hypothetical protein